jgi:hypothetical protein
MLRPAHAASAGKGTGDDTEQIIPQQEKNYVGQPGDESEATGIMSLQEED